MKVSWRILDKYYGIMLIILFSLCSKSILFAQDWTKDVSKNRWGDITGYSYFQRTTGVARGDTEISVVVAFAYSGSDAQLKNCLAIYSLTIGDLVFHPAAGFLDEAVTVSLRSNGTTTTYKGTTVSAKGNYNTVAILVFDSELIKKIKSPGQWDLLIEGKRWYIRSKIIGNLPNE